MAIETRAAPAGKPAGGAIRGSLAGLDPKLRALLKTLGASEVIALACGSILAAYALDRWLELGFWARAALLAAALYLSARAYRRARRRLAMRFGIEELAAAAERFDPALDGQLVNALELPAEARKLEAAGGSDLERALAARAAREAERAALETRARWGRAFDASVAWRWAALALVAAVLLAGVAARAPGSFGFWLQRGLLLTSEPWPRKTHFILDREGAEWHHARKDPLEIAGWVAGEIPREVRVRIESGSGLRVARIQPGTAGRVEVADAGGAVREVEAKRVFHVLPAVTEPLVFRVEGGDNRTPDVDVLVHDRPRILAARFHLRYPQYLELEPRTVENPGGDVTVPAGTEVDLEAESDQDLGGGWVRFGKGEREPSAAVDGNLLRFTFKPQANGFFEVSVTSAEWALSSEPPLRFGFVVIPDRAPSVTLELAGESRIATPRGKIAYRIEAGDDHGLSALHFLRTARAPGDTRADEDLTVVEEALELDVERGEKGVRAVVDGELALEPLALDPGTALVLQAAAADNDALDGPKRTFSEKETILIVELDDFRAAMERIRIEAQAAIEDLARRENAVADALAGWKPEAGSEGSAASTAGETSAAEGSQAAPGAKGGASAKDGATAKAGATAKSGATAKGGASAKSPSGSSRDTSGSGKESAGASAKGSSRPAAAKDGGRAAGARERSSPRDLAEEQNAIGKEASAVGERLRDMARELQRNDLLDPAEERRFRDEVEKELERAAEERLPRSAAGIRALPGAEGAQEKAQEMRKEAEAIADEMKKVADRLAGSGDFREVLFRLERILDLQRRVIGATEKGVSTEKQPGSQVEGQKEF